MRIEQEQQHESVPTISLDGAAAASTCVVVELDLVDAANAVLCKVNTTQAATTTLALFRSKLREFGVARIPKRFAFQLAGSTLEAAEEETTTLEQVILRAAPVLVGGGKANASFFSERPRILLLPLGWHEDSEASGETEGEANKEPSQIVHEVDAFGRTPLHEAVEVADATAVQALLVAGANVMRADHRGATCFHNAAAKGNVDILVLLYNHVKTGNGDSMARHLLEMRDKVGRTALLFSLQHRRKACVLQLLQWNADDTVVDSHESSATELLRKLGMDISSAVRSNDMELVRVHLARYGRACPDPQPPMMTTPLHDAAEMGFDEPLEAMLACGWDPSSRDANLQSPLHLACARGHFQVFAKLVAAGASLSVTDKNGRTGLHKACERATPGHMQIIHHFVDAATSTITTSSSSLSNLLIMADSENRTALHVAAACGWEEAVRALLDAGVDADAKDAPYRWSNEPPATPACLAYVGGKTACFQVLVAAGAHLAFSKILRVAVQRGDSPIVAAVIAAWPEDKKAALVQDNLLLLHDAIKGKHEDMQLEMLNAGWSPMTIDPATHLTTFEAAVGLNNYRVLSWYIDRVDHAIQYAALRVACDSDCDQSINLLLDRMSSDEVISTIYIAAGSGAPKCLKMAILKCRGMDQKQDWIAGRSSWIHAGSATTSCPHRGACRLSTPLLHCLHAALPMGHNVGNKARQFQEAGMVLLEEAEFVGLALPLVRASCSAGCTAIHLAASNGMWDLCCKLVSIDPSCLHQPQPVSLCTPLHLAITAGGEGEAAAITMIEKGAPLLARNAQGMTPLQMARTRHNEPLKKAIRAALDQLRNEIDKDVPLLAETFVHKLGVDAAAPSSSPKKKQQQHHGHHHGHHHHQQQHDNISATAAATTTTCYQVAAEEAAAADVSAAVAEEIVWEENGDEAEIVAEEDSLASCGYCGRRFLPDRLVVHRHACKKASRPRKPAPPMNAGFVAALEAHAATVAAASGAAACASLVDCPQCSRKFFPAVLPHHAAVCRMAPPPTAFAVSVELTRAAALEAMRISTREEKEAKCGFVVLDDGRMQCPVCSRGFAPDKIDRHAPTCKATARRL